MCGRFTLSVSNEEVEEYLTTNLEVSSIKIESQYPRYNISPGQSILTIIHDGQRLRAGELEWGFLPAFATTGFKPLINARAETIREKPSFKESFQRHRCLIVSDGYYEWQRSADSKQPFYIRKGNGMALMAGIYTSKQLPDGSKKYTAAIITTSANEQLAGVHDRMPLFIEEDQAFNWLSTHPTLDNTSTPFSLHPVSSMVNSSRVDKAELIQPL